MPITMPFFRLSPGRLLAVALISALPAGLWAQDAPSAPKKWTVDDVLAIKGVGGVAISPDGKRVAYVVSTADRDANINKSDIWVVSTEGGTPIQVTHGPRADRAPQWVADGSWLAFLSDRADNKRTQVYGIDPSGGEAWPVTKHETSISNFALSPNGQRVAFLAGAPASKGDQDLEKERGRPIVRDSVYTADWTRVWTAALTNRTAGEAKASSPDGLDVTGVVWAPDSRGIAWAAKPSPTVGARYQSNVYAQSEPGAEVRKVTRLAGGATVVAWPNDVGLLVLASGKVKSTDNDRLWLVPLSAEDPIALTDSLEEDPGFVSANPRELLVEADIRSGRALFRIPLANGHVAGAPNRLTDDAHFYSGFSAAKNGGMVAFLSETASQPADVHVSTLAAFTPKRLTNVNPQAAAFGYGERRVVTWRSKADSTEVEGVLTLPVGYQSGTKVPLLLVIHGGPTGVSSNRYPSRSPYPVAVFNSLGYAVLQPNFRGSTGYGRKFRLGNVGDIPGKDWVDVNSGVDALVRMGIADSTRMGVMGWSYGGFQTYWAITHTTRFAAASAGAGANDLTAFWSQTDIGEYMTMLLGVPPWENLELYDQHSAYRLVKNVTTPTLIQVGNADQRVPREQSIQFYEAMKGAGKAPVKLVEYPGQPHGVNDPRLVRDLLNRNVQWFTYWVPVTGQKPAPRVANAPEP